jgi:hypothetical protein
MDFELVVPFKFSVTILSAMILRDKGLSASDARSWIPVYQPYALFGLYTLEFCFSGRVNTLDGRVYPVSGRVTLLQPTASIVLDARRRSAGIRAVVPIQRSNGSRLSDVEMTAH